MTNNLIDIGNSIWSTSGGVDGLVIANSDNATVLQNGFIRADQNGISGQSSNTLNILGSVSGRTGYGILLNGGNCHITVAGVVSGAAGIAVGGSPTDKTEIFNFGIIQGATGYAVIGGSGGDLVRNQGLLVGHVRLQQGDDLYDGRFGRVTGAIFGDAGDDTLLAGSGDDTLDGGSGEDLLSGGGGFDFASYQTAGTAVIANLSNPLLNDGDAFGDTYDSIEGLIGSAFHDKLTGNSGANVLDGAAGADTLAGGAGNDTYYVDDAGDKIVEALAKGTDKVVASVSYALAANLENLTLAGTSAINGTGNSLVNRIAGNIGNNVLNGKAGNDILSGGDGADTFRFDTALNAQTNVDRITDFQVGTDTIALENAVFTTLATGALAAGAFKSGTNNLAGDANDRIIYNTATGALLYDPDGTGAKAAILFARLQPGTLLTTDDFAVT
jgi:Ca2+-binding RTX toxin-like protein